MDPTIGRIVHYTLSEIDANLIQGRRGYAAMHAAPIASNVAHAGDTYPAIVVRTFGGTAVNLKVLLDGEDTYWACSRNQHGEAGVPSTWAWPRFANGGPVSRGSVVTVSPSTSDGGRA